MAKEADKLKTKEGLFAGKTVLITGAGGGLGWGISLSFAREGARVIVTDIDDAKGQEVVRLISKESDAQPQYFHLNVREVAAFPELLAKVGPIDVLVNNAGINTEHGFLTMTPEAWDEVMSTNLRGHFFLSQAVAKQMIEGQKRGVICWISSVHQEVYQGRPHYVASKAAIARLVKEIAVELAAYGIRVVGIAPGGIYVGERTEDPLKAPQEKTIPLGGRNGIPSDIGQMAVALCSDRFARQVTGEVITVSGGQYLRIGLW